PTMAAFPDFWAGRLPHCVFRGLLSVHSRYGLHTCQVTYMTLYTGGFSRFVTSTTAPIATGRSDLAGRDSHPLRNRAFARRTKNRTIRSVAQTYRQRRVNRNRVLQRQNADIWPGEADLQKRSFAHPQVSGELAEITCRFTGTRRQRRTATFPTSRLFGHVPPSPLQTTTRNTSSKCRILRSSIGWSQGHLSFSRRRECSLLSFLSKTRCGEDYDNQQEQHKKGDGCEPEGNSQDECVNCFKGHIVFAHEFFLLIPCPACGLLARTAP
ncbi:MAG: hypothetical protein QOE55_2309, partial [Acidobacteriaceae bacterium]|nr:hypothetical protein [Acidobacteriaceae bacterium]